MFYEFLLQPGNCMNEFMGLIYGDYEAKVLKTFKCIAYHPLSEKLIMSASCITPRDYLHPVEQLCIA